MNKFKNITQISSSYLIHNSNPNFNKLYPLKPINRFIHNKTMTTQKQIFYIDSFAFRHWDGTNDSVQISVSKEEFLKNVHDYFYQNGEKLVEGYAPFCKHLFIPNFCNVKQTSIEITDENKHLLESDYVARRVEELPVLVRWFPSSKVQVYDAKFLDIILYSREQIKKENEDMGLDSNPNEDLFEWGIISIKGQDVDYETPMQPITMLRNSLGREEGGSGVPLDKKKYMESVEYWKKHATISD